MRGGGGIRGVFISSSLLLVGPPLVVSRRYCSEGLINCAIFGQCLARETTEYQETSAGAARYHKPILGPETYRLQVRKESNYARIQ